MHRFLHYLWSFVLGSFGVFAVGAAWVLHEGHALDAESKAYVDTAVPAIVSDWNEKQLLDRATPEFLGSVTPAEVKAQFGRFSRVGHLVEYQGATGEAVLRYNLVLRGTVSASYIAKGRFQNGDAVLRILLSKRGGRWLIQGFQVDAKPSGPPQQRA
jgi:hypothetical protein